jgi:hypothetical protein
MKNLFLNILLIVVLFVSCKKEENTPPPTIAVAVGDSYQGGKIAYILQAGDIGYDANVLHGLIAAPSDQGQSGTVTWGCGQVGPNSITISGADGTAIGTGAQNTIDIMNGCGTAGIAAELCGDLVLNGYSDWYLPSKDELEKLYLNQFAIGGFTLNSWYWSSTEVSTHIAWAFNFSADLSVPAQPIPNGYAVQNGKAGCSNVRAIRSF